MNPFCQLYSQPLSDGIEEVFKNVNDMKHFEHIVSTGSNSQSLGEDLEEVYKNSEIPSFEDKTIPFVEEIEKSNVSVPNIPI